MKKMVETIGRSVTIKGELRATQDLTIEGQVEGTIALDNNELTIGPDARIDAPVLAKTVNVMGKVEGTITATEAINIRETATVDGALVAPRVGIEDGAAFRGQIDISVTIPLQRMIKRLRPEKPHMRFFRQLVGHSFSMMRTEAVPGELFGVSPKVAEATMRVRVETDSHRASPD